MNNVGPRIKWPIALPPPLINTLTNRSCPSLLDNNTTHPTCASHPLFGCCWHGPRRPGGPVAYGICQTGCNSLAVACYAAAGFTFGTVIAAPATPAVILACNAGWEHARRHVRLWPCSRRLLKLCI
ncbi:hypothetical protein BD779DRAFT_640049 [Infundibulicybe gibba]|nr:hypothetical protein BD779DRAFT_640049 [Infundibulicybe gibba]